MDSFRQTMKFINQHPPMSKSEIKILEKNEGLLKFDIYFKHKDDEKTMWGNSKMKCSKAILRYSANHIFDFLLDGYDIWLRDMPNLENDTSEISDKSVRYIMTLEAHNMSEEAVPLEFRRVNDWFVISLHDDDQYGTYAREFYDKFGIKISQN